MIPSTVIRVVRPHVGLLAALAVVAALVAGARAGSSPERYQADALLRLEQLAANDLLGAATPNRIDPDRYLANELEVLTSGPVIDAAIAAGADEAVLDALSVSGVGETDIVQIAAVADQPEVAVAAVDAVVAAYQALTTEAARVDVERQVAELDAQLLVLSERLASSDQRLADPALPAAEAAVLETQRETDASTYAQLAADRQRTQARVGLAAPAARSSRGRARPRPCPALRRSRPPPVAPWPPGWPGWACWSPATGSRTASSTAARSRTSTSASASSARSRPASTSTTGQGSPCRPAARTARSPPPSGCSGGPCRSRGSSSRVPSSSSPARRGGRDARRWSPTWPPPAPAPEWMHSSSTATCAEPG